MIGLLRVLALLSAYSLTFSVVAALDPVVIEGNKFFYSGAQEQLNLFNNISLCNLSSFIKGIVYQQGVSHDGGVNDVTAYRDPLTDSAACERDLPYLQRLGINLIRVYAVDAHSDHSGCLNLLSNTGIYVLAALPQADAAIDTAAPRWDTSLFSSYTAVIDSLQGFTNVLGFFVADEIAFNATTSSAFAFVKAAVRDTKAYIRQVTDRPIGVGYADSSTDKLRTNVASYLTHGESAETVDFLGYSDFEWCTGSNYRTSGYKSLQSLLEWIPVPVFLSGYGCNQGRTRTFDEVSTIYGDRMTPFLSGGIVFEYFNDASNYGLVDIVSNNKVSLLPEYTSFSNQIAQVTPTSTSSSAQPSRTSPFPFTGPNWQPSLDLPPSADAEYCKCRAETFRCKTKPNLRDPEAAFQAALAATCKKWSTPCTAVQANGSTAVYGSYSMCSRSQQIAYLLSFYTFREDGVGSRPVNCEDIAGPIATDVPVDPYAASNKCSSVLSAAYAAGTGASTVGRPGHAGPTAFPVTSGFDQGTSTPNKLGLLPAPTPVGAIIGGIIGGMVFLAAVLLTVFLVLRRRRRYLASGRRSDPDAESDRNAFALLPRKLHNKAASASTASGLSGNTAAAPSVEPVEMDTTAAVPPTELPVDGSELKHELPSGYEGSEMPTPKT